MKLKYLNDGEGQCQHNFIGSDKDGKFTVKICLQENNVYSPKGVKDLQYRWMYCCGDWEPSHSARGIYFEIINVGDIDAEDYSKIYDYLKPNYREIERLNFSTWKDYDDAVRKANYKQENPKPPSKAMKLGTAIHMAILEPVLFAHTYLFQDDIIIFGEELNRRKPTHRKYLIDHNIKVLPADEIDIINSCKYQAQNDPEIRDILEGCKKEVEIYWEYPSQNGMIPCKSKIDFMNIEEGYFGDIKTIKDGVIFNNKFLENHIKKFKIREQLEFYREAIEDKFNTTIDTCYLIFFETSMPTMARIVEIPVDYLEAERIPQSVENFIYNYETRDMDTRQNYRKMKLHPYQD